MSEHEKKFEFRCGKCARLEMRLLDKGDAPDVVCECKQVQGRETPTVSVRPGCLFVVGEVEE